MVKIQYVEDTPKKPKKKREPVVIRPRKALTSNEIIDKIVNSIDPLESTNPDDLYLRNILTANRGKANRNATYQRNIVRMTINKLIEMELIK